MIETRASRVVTLLIFVWSHWLAWKEDGRCFGSSSKLVKLYRTVIHNDDFTMNTTEPETANTALCLFLSGHVSLLGGQIADVLAPLLS